MSSANDDVYVLYLKGVDNSTGANVEFTRLGGIFTKEGTSVTPVVPEIPTETPETPQTQETPKDETVKNPKTGVSMSIALGLIVIALASAGIIVCKKLSTKQL